MKKFVEKTLDAALIKASTELGCSVADLEYEVVQNPSSGFLGFGKKDAIIIVETRMEKPKFANAFSVKSAFETRFVPESNPLETQTQKAKSTLESKESLKAFDSKPLESSKESPKAPQESPALNANEKIAHQKDIYDESFNDYDEYATSHIGDNTWGGKLNDELHKHNVELIASQIKDLFARLPFEISDINVFLGENNTLCVSLDGRDCALLIGERGYRYKALSYLLFNWINPKYGYTLRLEIAEFLQNQEEMIDVYLRDIVKLIKLNGKAQTKVLDGILVYIALNKLRKIFPDKYVSVRQNEADEKYIIINDFKR